MKSSRGFTYAEVLIAGAILSVVIVTVVAGFYQCAASVKSSERKYQAVCAASELLSDARGVLEAGGDLSVYLAGFTDGNGFGLSLSLFSTSDGALSRMAEYTAGAPGDTGLPEISLIRDNSELWAATAPDGVVEAPRLLDIAVYDKNKLLCRLTAPVMEASQ